MLVHAATSAMRVRPAPPTCTRVHKLPCGSRVRGAPGRERVRVAPPAELSDFLNKAGLPEGIRVTHGMRDLFEIAPALSYVSDQFAAGIEKFWFGSVAAPTHTSRTYRSSTIRGFAASPVRHLVSTRSQVSGRATLFDATVCADLRASHPGHEFETVPSRTPCNH
jgi:hypothetical protein